MSHYATPHTSARTSEFTSVYDGSSVCASSRTYATAEMVGDTPPVAPGASPSGTDRRHARQAYAAALDAFGRSEEQARGGASSSTPAEGASPARGSLDQRHVFSAARHGKHKEVEASLQAGFDPHHMDSFGNTIFHVACQNGNKRIAKLGIKYGGDLDAQNGKGNTGLHFLIAYGYPEIAEYFLEKGARADVQNDVGKCAHEGIR